MNTRLEQIKNNSRDVLIQLRAFISWTILGIIMGILGGLVGVAFHWCVDYVNQFREAHFWVLYLLPLGGVVIALIYRYTRLKISANDVLDATRSIHSLPLRTLPVIFVSTVLTQFVGGSAGKEGAAIQMGGTLGYHLGKLIGLDEKDSHVAIMCGLSAVFSAVFGTPVTAALFAMEVISIGAMYYVALIPCVASALVAAKISRLAGIKWIAYSVAFPSVGALTLTEVFCVSALCALISIVFCFLLHKGCKSLAKKINNKILRGAVGGALILALTLLADSTDYNGAGFNLISSALAGNAPWYSFALKIIFTSITICFGFKGGEIVPTMAIGATLGCAVAALFGADPAFLAAIGFLGLFCSMVNCPITTVFLGIEVFGVRGMIFYAIVAAVTFVLSGNFGLYSSQKLLYSKTKAEFINIHTRE